MSEVSIIPQTTFYLDMLVILIFVMGKGEQYFHCTCAECNWNIVVRPIKDMYTLLDGPGCGAYL